MLPGVNSEVFPDAFITVNALEAIGLTIPSTCPPIEQHTGSSQRRCGAGRKTHRVNSAGFSGAMASEKSPPRGPTCELVHNRVVRIELTFPNQHWENLENDNSSDQKSRNPHRHLYRGHCLFRAAVLRDFVSRVIARRADPRRGFLCQRYCLIWINGRLLEGQTVAVVFH